MKIYIAIDDTDNIDEGATGQSAKQIMKRIEKKYSGICQGLTRHQLLLHPDIAYTSHNSSMCFVAEIDAGCLDLIIPEIGDFLARESAPGSDPGLCLVIDEKIQDRNCLINFGYEAKRRIMTKEEAYALAHELNFHLSEHGGTGLGVIGALAGVGLRMTNNDGRFQGRLEIKELGTVVNVAEILKESPVEIVQSLDGYVLGSDEEVRLGEKLKTVLLKGKQTLLVYHGESRVEWNTCLNEHLEKY